MRCSSLWRSSMSTTLARETGLPSVLWWGAATVRWSGPSSAAQTAPRLVPWSGRRWARALAPTCWAIASASQMARRWGTSKDGGMALQSVGRSAISMGAAWSLSSSSSSWWCWSPCRWTRPRPRRHSMQQYCPENPNRPTQRIYPMRGTTPLRRHRPPCRSAGRGSACSRSRAGSPSPAGHRSAGAPPRPERCPWVHEKGSGRLGDTRTLELTHREAPGPARAPWAWARQRCAVVTLRHSPRPRRAVKAAGSQSWHTARPGAWWEAASALDFGF